MRCHMFRCKLCAVIRSNCTLRSSVLVQKLTFPQLGKKFSSFKDPKRLLLLSQDYVTGPSPHPKKQIHAVYVRSTLILFFHLPPDIPCGLSSSLFPTKPLYRVFLLSHMPSPSRSPSIALIISGQLLLPQFL